jgi:hypothetical protein
MTVWLLAWAFAAALPAAAQPLYAEASCDIAAAGVVATDCCGDAGATADCRPGDCAGGGAIMLMSGAERAFAALVSQSAQRPVARILAPLARAPDTAPPKPVV